MRHTENRRAATGLILVGALAFGSLACSDDDEKTSDRQRDFRANQDRWQAQSLVDYDVTLQRLCFCPPHLAEPARVEVREGEVVAAEVVSSGEPLPINEVPTIDDLFLEIEMALDRDWELVEVTYDPARGYPTEIALDPGGGVADAGVNYYCSDLVVATAAPR